MSQVLSKKEIKEAERIKNEGFKAETKEFINDDEDNEDNEDKKESIDDYETKLFDYQELKELREFKKKAEIKLKESSETIKFLKSDVKENSEKIRGLNEKIESLRALSNSKNIKMNSYISEIKRLELLLEKANNNAKKWEERWLDDAGKVEDLEEKLAKVEHPLRQKILKLQETNKELEELYLEASTLAKDLNFKLQEERLEKASPEGKKKGLSAIGLQ